MSDIAKWSLTIIDPRGELFRQNQGTGKPPEKIYWNGKSTTGELVLSAENYPFEFYVEDVLGNEAAVVDNIPVDILVTENKGEYEIVIMNFSFEPNSAAFESNNPAAVEKNEWILQRIAEFCRSRADYYITVEGHAVSIYWNDNERAKLEQENQLAPLTKARADTVKSALTALGIEEDRIDTEGVGGADPIVPHGDLENRWKNKRIEFLLRKQS
jgi:outer membrane protein OmpA-like peptidoglycan-associated protein